MPKFAFKLQDPDHYEVGTVFIDRQDSFKPGHSIYSDTAREYLRRKELKRCLFRLTPDQLEETREKIELLEQAGKTRSEAHAALLTHQQEAPRKLVYLVEVPDGSSGAVHLEQRKAGR